MSGSDKALAVAEIVDRTDELLLEAKKLLVAGEEFYAAYGIEKKAKRPSLTLGAKEKKLLQSEWDKYFPGIAFEEDLLLLPGEKSRPVNTKSRVSKNYI